MGDRSCGSCPWELVVRGAAIGVAGSVDRLSSTDQEILTLLQFHRVLTTPQLISLTGRPERTVDYRLSRLRTASLVDRTRPYAASGSAPYYWWLTRGGARLVEGVSPAPGKAAPNPLFLRHSAAIAGLYVALLEVGPHVGLKGPTWRRDETAWEEWSSLSRTHAHLRPDAHVEVVLDVDGEMGRAGGFIEVDFATMDQRRLRAKVARYLDYCRDRAWWHRHPGCPALLLITTSDARVSHFLANVERERPSPSLSQERYPIDWEPLVAACPRVSAPEEAMSAPVWRTSVADAPSKLRALLSGEVRQYLRLVANVDARRADKEHHDQIKAIGPLAQEHEHLADALSDQDGARALRHLFTHIAPGNNGRREEWAEQHLGLVLATHAWWVEQDGRSGWPPAPTAVVAGWRRIYRGLWSEQAYQLLDQAARSEDNPRLRRSAADMANGTLVDEWRLTHTEPLDGPAAADQARIDYESQREQSVNQTTRELPLHRRLATSRATLESDYDTAHLLICVDCGIASHDDPEATRYGRQAECPLCHGRLVGVHDAPPLPPELSHSLAAVTERLRHFEECH